MKSKFRNLKSIFGAIYFFSWEGLLKRALLIMAVFLLAHFLNGREYAGGLFGTYNVVGFKRLFGLIYALFYFLATIVAPVFLIAAFLIFLGERLRMIEKYKKNS